MVLSVPEDAKILTYHVDGGYTGWQANLMWEIAATIGIAEKNDLVPVFVEEGYYKSRDESEPMFWDLFDRSKFNLMPSNYIKSRYQPSPCPELSYHYAELKLDNKRSWSLEGYFQTIKYWEHCQDKIRAMFEFSDVVKRDCKKLFEPYSIFDDTHHRVAIHVRRGDYLKHPTCHPVLTIEYYTECANDLCNRFKDAGINKPVQFLIFTDDTEWCYKNFVHSNIPVFDNRCVVNSEYIPSQDMYMMTQCDSFIIANSSFSWWGSYLGKNPDKLVYAPTKDKWYGSSYAHWNLDDLYLDNWILK